MISHIGWLRTKQNISQLTFEFVTGYVILGVSLVAQMVKNLPAMQRHRFDPWVRKISWRRVWLPIPVFLPGELHGQRSLAGYSPWCSKESDTTKRLTHTSILETK